MMILATLTDGTPTWIFFSGLAWEKTKEGKASDKKRIMARQTLMFCAISLLRFTSNLARAELGDADRRCPGILRPCHARSSDVGVDEIRFAFLRGLAGSLERFFELTR